MKTPTITLPFLHDYAKSKKVHEKIKNVVDNPDFGIYNLIRKGFNSKSLLVFNSLLVVLTPSPERASTINLNKNKGLPIMDKLQTHTKEVPDMKFDSIVDGLVMPSDVDFCYATNTGNVFAQYKREDGDSVFAQVGGALFAADLLAANAKSARSVTSDDLNNIIAKVYAEALSRACNVSIVAPHYLEKVKATSTKRKAASKKTKTASEQVA